MSMQPVLIETAAALLNITQPALRDRIRRGTLKARRSDDGRWYVHLSPTAMRDASLALSAEMVQELAMLRSQVKHLEDELAERTLERDFWRQAFQREQAVVMKLGTPTRNQREVIPGI